ncbi:MAG TPA: PAS domain-containing sensor histidine kinase [Terriglobales bacterium]|nr:PAS domain-containing sensor histidine kinase [Terriglobales bacterium]
MADGNKNGSLQKLLALSRRELIARLSEAEETLRAIRSGKVDAIVVNGQGEEKVFTLQGADHTYRVFVERMNEGAAVLSYDHTVLHCNGRFARFLGAGLQSVIGSSMLDLVWPEDHPKLDALLRRAAQRNCRGEIRLQSRKGTPLSVHLSLNPLRLDSTRAVCLIASDLSEMKRAEQELRASSEQLRNLAAHLLSVREEERARISREVHDELGQSLTAVKMDLAWLAGRLPRRNGPMLKRIRSTRQLADSIIQSIRRISTELRPAVLDLGLAAAVEWQVQEFQARSGIQCKLRLLTREVVASNASTAMFRIFQETLTNVARHAKATRAEVVLQKQRDRLVLLIRDNGRGFDQADPSLSKSLGLLGMRERAAILGGRVNISSAPGKGTTVAAWIPLPSPEESGIIPAAIP